MAAVAAVAAGEREERERERESRCGDVNNAAPKLLKVGLQMKARKRLSDTQCHVFTSLCSHAAGKLQTKRHVLQIV